jgi:hypothetical protein
MAAPAEVLIKACQDSWEEENLPGLPNKNNCSGFLRSVAGHLNITLYGQQADDLVESIRKNWVKVDTASSAAQFASQGMLVVAGLKGSEHDPKRANGHVAVIVPGPFYHGKYPRCWCGSTGTAQSQGNKSVGEVWNRHDRDQVTYYRAP